MSKFRKGTGPSRLGAKHLMKLLNGSRELKEAVVIAVNGVLDGTLAEHPKLERLAEARGIPLAKPSPTARPEQKGVRPIACGETLTQLMTKLVGALSNKVLAKLNNFDLGFGKASGCESIILGIQTAYLGSVKQEKPFYLLQTDFKNAFESVFRETLFDVAAEVCPEIIPFLGFRYGKARIVFEDKEGKIAIDPRAGCAQGCPISPLLFQLVMERILRRVREEGIAVVFSFLDDVGALCHSLDDV